MVTWLKGHLQPKVNILSDLIKNYLGQNGILSDFQSGFRTGHSTTTALPRVVDDIIQAWDRGLATVLTLLDFSKAFDAINHNLLMSKCKHIGFNDLSLA
nr:unnamed protein product [Callosobruchus analis]